MDRTFKYTMKEAIILPREKQQAQANNTLIHTSLTAAKRYNHFSAFNQIIIADNSWNVG